MVASDYSTSVVIIGAGIGGLALAQGLLAQNIAFRIFERDVSLHSRTQGYRVRIADEGIAALRQLLPPVGFSRLLAGCANRSAGLAVSNGNSVATHLDARTAAAATSPFPGAGGRPPTQITGDPLVADRAVLRTVLSEGLGDALIFGAEYARYEDGNDGGVRVIFTDGSVINARILVGCDGVWSAVRRQLLPDGANLRDAGGRLVYGKTALQAAGSSAELLGAPGMTLVRDTDAPWTGGACLIEAMHFDHHHADHDDLHLPDDYLYWVLFLPRSVDGDVLPTEIKATRSLVSSVTQDWHADVRRLFDAAQAMTASRTLTTDPSELEKWTAEDRSRSVTLVGDAAHAMPPTAAFGATTALRDAAVLSAELGRCAIGRGGPTSNFATALRAYESQMGIYAVEAITRSAIGGKVMFGMKSFSELPKAGTAA